MKYIEEFQTKEAVLPLIEELKKAIQPNKSYRLMEFCGGHTHSFVKTGLIDLLPPQITLVHGPGCPVCVLPSYPVKNCIEVLSKHEDVVLATYADMMKVQTSDGDSLLKAKGRGLSVFPIYSPQEALDLAQKNPSKRVVFLAIGFETTIPPTLLVLNRAIKEKVDNFYIYCNHLNTAMALTNMLENEVKATLSSVTSSQEYLSLDGFIGPGHVSLITGSKFFESFSAKYKKPIVISGFTPFDLAKSLVMLVNQINQGESKVEVEYSRAVSQQGNLVSLGMMEKYLELRESFEWRGLGVMLNSAFKLKEEFSKWDAEHVFSLEAEELEDYDGCLCPDILVGAKKPLNCEFFGSSCTPDSPLGVCMVSSEGACSAYFLGGRHLPNVFKERVNVNELKVES